MIKSFLYDTYQCLWNLCQNSRPRWAQTIRAQIFHGNVFKRKANTERSRYNLNYFCFLFYFYAPLEAAIYDDAEEPLDDPSSLNGNAYLFEMQSPSLGHGQSACCQSWKGETSVFSYFLSNLVRDWEINVDFCVLKWLSP